MDKHGFTVGVVALSVHNILSAIALTSLFGIYLKYLGIFVPLLTMVLFIDVVVIIIHMTYRYHSGALRNISTDLRSWVVVHSFSSMFAITVSWYITMMATFPFWELVALCIIWIISLVTGDMVFIHKYRFQ